MRSSESKGRAERALARLAASVGPHARDFVVVGGLNPGRLAHLADAPHEGTVDIDLAVAVGLVYERDEQDFGWLEAGLRAAGFEPGPPHRAWRWKATVDGQPVYADVLCDVQDNRGRQIELPGCRDLTANNLIGPAAALTDTVERSLISEDDHRALTVRFAGLGGYLLAKASAVVGRTATKDTYDLAFVVLKNPGGPRAAAVAAFESLPADRDREYVLAFRAALGRLVDSAGTAVQLYATQRITDGEPETRDFIARDVSAGVRQCLLLFDELVAGRDR